MTLNNPRPGPNSVPEYQVSAIPWVTSSILPATCLAINFPQVTQFFTVRNIGSGSMKVGFSLNGMSTVNSNYFLLTGSESYSGDFRIKTLFLSGSNGQAYTVIAGLTTIEPQLFPEITGSSGFLGVG